MCICQSQSPNLSLPPNPPSNCKFILCILTLLIFHFVDKFICSLFLQSTYKQYHIFFFDLLHSVWESLRLSMLLQMALFHSFYGRVIFHRMNIYHVFSTHPSVDGHLGCSPVLAILNSAAMNRCTDLSVCSFSGATLSWYLQLFRKSWTQIVSVSGFVLLWYGISYFGSFAFPYKF